MAVTATAITLMITKEPARSPGVITSRRIITGRATARTTAATANPTTTSTSMRSASLNMGQPHRLPLERVRETRHELIDVLLRTEQEFQLAEVFGKKPDVPAIV